MAWISVRRRWLPALLGAGFVVDLVLAFLFGGRADLVALPGGLALVGCACLAMYRPGSAAFIGAAVLVLWSGVIEGRNGSGSGWVGVHGLLLSEVLAGGALVVLAAWRARAMVAGAGIGALALAGLAAVLLRTGEPDRATLFVGFGLLVATVAAGVHLRRSGWEGLDSELGGLARRRWPLAAILAVLLLFDVGMAGARLELLALGGVLVAAVCALVAPRAPVRAALTAAAALAVTALPLVVTRIVGFDPAFVSDRSAPGQLPFSLTQLAACMALVALVIRYAPPWAAAACTVALSVANFGPLLNPGRNHLRESQVLVFLLVVAVAAGLYLRARDRERRQSARVAVTGVQQAERMALARELHDVVAHHVTGMVVAAQAARLVAERDPGVAAGALEKIENSGAEALTAMRLLVGSLRGATPAGESAAATVATSDLAADIRALVDRFNGPPVQLELSLPDALGHEMGRTVLRVVQESLTNVSKHATGATNVFVGIAKGYGDFGEELHVFVKDDGTARRSGSGGYGLIGMRERVELLGGWFSAGLGGEGGWVVKVKLPLRTNA